MENQKPGCEPDAYIVLFENDMEWYVTAYNPDQAARIAIDGAISCSGLPEDMIVRVKSVTKLTRH